MSTYVALLRGINVGGKRRVPMAKLQALFTDLGHDDVVTYVQSGNVVFSSRSGRADALAGAIEREIERALHLDVTVLVRTRAELRAVVDKNPYVTERADTSKLHVVFLGDRPKAAAVRTLDPDRSPPDTFTVVGREVYLRCPNGIGRSKLTIDWFERTLGTSATARNWKTVTTLLDLASGA